MTTMLKMKVVTNVINGGLYCSRVTGGNLGQFCRFVMYDCFVVSYLNKTNSAFYLSGK